MSTIIRSYTKGNLQCSIVKLDGNHYRARVMDGKKILFSEVHDDLESAAISLDVWAEERDDPDLDEVVNEAMDTGAAQREGRAWREAPE